MSKFLRFALEESNEWIRGIFCFLYNFQLIFTFYPQFSFFYLLITLTDGGFMSVEVEEKVLESELSTAVESEVEQAQTKEEDKVILPFAVEKEYVIEPIERLPKKPFYSFVKRTFDIFTSLIGLIVAFPFMLIIAIIIKCTSKGPILYKQERLGYKGKKFMLAKFRSMRVDAEAQGAKWSDGDDDPRIYPFGRFLRKTHLDELPQLWTIFIGKMSLIGPRPEREAFAIEFEKYIHGFSERLKVKPGITGWAQVNGGYFLKPEEKIVFDVEYIKNRSIRMEIKILFKSVGVVLGRRGVK